MRVSTSTRGTNRESRFAARKPISLNVCADRAFDRERAMQPLRDPLSRGIAAFAEKRSRGGNIGCRVIREPPTSKAARKTSCRALLFLLRLLASSAFRAAIAARCYVSHPPVRPSVLPRLALVFSLKSTAITGSRFTERISSRNTRVHSEK